MIIGENVLLHKKFIIVKDFLGVWVVHVTSHNSKKYFEICANAKAIIIILLLGQSSNDF